MIFLLNMFLFMLFFSAFMFFLGTGFVMSTVLATITMYFVKFSKK